MRRRKQRKCRICKKSPVWRGGDVKSPGPFCKRCYHKKVSPGRQGVRQKAPQPQQELEPIPEEFWMHESDQMFYTAHSVFGGGTLCFQVDDVQALAGYLAVEAGPEVYGHGPHEFSIRDPSGHLLIFYEKLIVYERLVDPPCAEEDWFP